MLFAKSLNFIVRTAITGVAFYLATIPFGFLFFIFFYLDSGEIPPHTAFLNSVFFGHFEVAAALALLLLCASVTFSIPGGYPYFSSTSSILEKVITVVIVCALLVGIVYGYSRYERYQEEQVRAQSAESMDDSLSVKEYVESHKEELRKKYPACFFVVLSPRFASYALSDVMEQGPIDAFHREHPDQKAYVYCSESL